MVVFPALSVAVTVSVPSMPTYSEVGQAAASDGDGGFNLGCRGSGRAVDRLPRGGASRKNRKALVATEANFTGTARPASTAPLL